MSRLCASVNCRAVSVEAFLASIIDRYVDDLLREYSHLGADEIARNALAFRAAIKQRVAEIEASGGGAGGTA